MYLSKFQYVFAKHCNIDDKETRRPPLLSLSLLLPTAESFMNCSVLLSTNIFSSSMMVMMILMIAKGSLRSATLPRYTLQKCAFPN